MIQEKDFLYRVPVKNALVTAPGKQVRNPEILVDLEGGEFMHGDILDANSTNKLIDQSVKDAIDNSIENGNYVTKDLLEAETSARTKSDEDLNAKIKAEQTRAEGKEKEISDKLAIVDGDSNTEGSFRKAIADVIAAAPEDLDTLKEIADKLAGNDDLHTALNQAITEKADASALTALEQKVATNTTALEGKQDKGNYIVYTDYSDNKGYVVDKSITITGSTSYDGSGTDIKVIKYDFSGIHSSTYHNCLATSDGTFKPISDFALKTELPTVPTNVSQLTNDSNFITQQDADAKYALANSLNTVNDSISSLRVGLSKKQNKITVNSVDITDIETADITKLRTIVRNLIDALNTSGLIRTNSNLE